GNEIIAEIESMIQVHLLPLEQIEQREKERVARIRDRINHINSMRIVNGLDSSQLHAHIEKLEAVGVDDSYQEYQEEAIQAREEVLTHLHESLHSLRTREAE